MPSMNPKKPVTREQAIVKMETYCARAEHSSGECRHKLKLMGLPAAEVMEVMEHLSAGRWFDDARFARAFINDKVYLQRRGRLYLRQALGAKGVARAVVDSALSDIDEERYRGAIEGLLRYKLNLMPKLAESFEGRTKLFRYGVQRGFESEQVSRALRMILSEKSDE